MGLCLIVNSRNQQEKKGEIYHFPLILRLRRQPTRRLGVQYGNIRSRDLVDGVSSTSYAL